MTTARRKLVAGNWKMNGLTASMAELVEMCDANPANCDVIVCPPFPLIGRFVGSAGNSHIEIGAQDCHTAESGAHTGDVSAALLKDVGATAVIVGHSERRTDHGETSALVKAKAEAALASGLIAIVCIGETEAQRDAGGAEALVTAQMRESLPAGATAANTVVAYEPVWAIGTGRTPTNEQIAAMHAALRAALKDDLGPEGDGVRLLYGGSVKPGNAEEIFAIQDVDGGLIGGASLKAVDFLGIVSAA
jgi:triosephosphate isomerase